VNGNGKRIAALCILLIVGGGWAGLASRYTGRAAQVASPTETSTKSFLNDPNSSSLTGSGMDNNALFLRMMLSVGIVMALGVAALYVSKRVLPRAAHAGGREIRVIETTYLGPRKTLHLVEVGSQRLLIASTHESITMLTPVGEVWTDAPRQPDNEGEES
jgi:flagellar biosynthetic protein FliO